MATSLEKADVTEPATGEPAAALPEPDRVSFPQTFLPHTIRGQVAAVIAMTVALMAAVLFVTLRQHERRELDAARANVAWQARLLSRDLERVL
jgi:hypothetical protein